MPVISLTKELSGDNPYSFPARHSANLVIIENAFQDINTTLVAVSGNLQTQIDNLDLNYATDAQLVAVSGNLQAQITNNFNSISTTNSTLVAVSGNLQNQLNNFTTDFLGLTDTPITYSGADTYVLTVSAGSIVFTPQDEIVPAITNVRGQEPCVVGQQVYTISYGQSITGAQPITSLVAPTSGSTLFVEAILDVTTEDFKVLLSEAPAEAGYKINWVTSYGSAINGNVIDNLQTQIDNLETQTSGITGGIPQLDARYLNVSQGDFITISEVADISGNLQGQINNKLDTSVFASLSGSFGDVTQSQLNALSGDYVNITGDTMTGTLTINTSGTGISSPILDVKKIDSDFYTTIADIGVDGAGGFKIVRAVSNMQLLGYGSIPNMIFNFGGYEHLRMQNGMTMFGWNPGSDVDFYIYGPSSQVDYFHDKSARTHEFTGDVTLNNNVIVGGNFTVEGTTTTVNSQEVLIEDNIITLNSNLSGAPPVFLESGIKIYRGPYDDPYYFTFKESDLVFTIGVNGISGDFRQTVATREDSPIDGGIAVWNVIENRFDTNSLYTMDSIVLDTELAGISGNLQGQLWSNVIDITNLRSNVNSISGDLNTLETYTAGITGGITQLNNAYVNVTGDTMTGDLTVNASIYTTNLGSHLIPVSTVHTNKLHLEPLSGGNIPAYEEGMLFYDGDKNVLKLYNDIPDVALDIGEENWVRIVNKTGVTITNGQVVYINGAQGNRPTAALADNVSELTANTVIGVATHDITNNSEGFITTFGLVRELDTSSFTDGDILWLGVAGAFTDVEPSVPKDRVRIGFVVTTHANQGVILVNIQVGEELSELHDVSLTSVADGDLLTYSQSLSAWNNTTVLGAVSGALDSRYVNATGDTMTGDLTLTTLASISGNLLTTNASGKLIDSGVTTTNGGIQNKTLNYSNAPITTLYTTTSNDAGTVVRISGGPTVIMNQSPLNGEHLWLDNEGTISALISGGVNTVQNETTQTLPSDSSYHLYYNGIQWRVL